jgi:hypothetical protein
MLFTGLKNCKKRRLITPDADPIFNSMNENMMPVIPESVI